MKSPAITIPSIIAAIVLTFTLPSLRAQDKAVTDALSPAHPVASPDIPQSSLLQTQITQWRGQYGGEEKSHTQLFATQKSWVDLWEKMGQQPPAALNEKTQAVFISIGQRPTGGYKPYIISATEQDGKLVVSYSDGHPILSDNVVQEVTKPWVAAIIPKSKLPVVFKELGN